MADSAPPPMRVPAPAAPAPGPGLSDPIGGPLPQPGEAREIAPGLRWLRMPLPFALDHINLWLLRDRLDGRAGWTAVDCGIDSPAIREAWSQVIAQGMDGLPLLRVVVTHMHPDHIGLAHWLCEQATTPTQDCRLWISATDWHAARLASQATTGYGGERAAAFFARHGLTDPDAVAQVRARGNYFGSMVPRVPDSFRRLMDGQRLQTDGLSWQLMAGHGHAPEHMALYAAQTGWLISGDMVLPRISTNVSVIDLEPEADPLALYLASLARWRALPADTWVLPSHGRPFIGLHTRIAQLEQHHAERLAETRATCTERPCSAADLLPVLFRRKLDLHQTTFAMGEAIAHLHALWHRGELQRHRDGEGIWRFSPA